MLRGPQTAAELKTRTRAAAPFASIADVASTLARLDERELVQRLQRRPGTREERWTHLLGEDSDLASPSRRSS